MKPADFSARDVIKNTGTDDFGRNEVLAIISEDGSRITMMAFYNKSKTNTCTIVISGAPPDWFDHISKSSFNGQHSIPPNSSVFCIGALHGRTVSVVNSSTADATCHADVQTF